MFKVIGLRTYVPGNPPSPFMASIWRMSFFWFPPFIMRIIFCICCGYCAANNLALLDY